MKIEDLLPECAQMQSFLEIECSGEITEMGNRVNTINAMMARSGEMLANAMRIRDEAMGMILERDRTYIQALSPSIAKKYIESKLYAENHLVKWLNRINATCDHQTENLRTLISFTKSQLELERKGY